MNLDLTRSDLYDLRNLVEGAQLRDEARGFGTSPARARILAILTAACQEDPNGILAQWQDILSMTRGALQRAPWAKHLVGIQTTVGAAIYPDRPPACQAGTCTCLDEFLEEED